MSVFSTKEEEGEAADVPLGPSALSHKLPPAQVLPHFGSRYADMQLRDAHEENPETILDEHVQRVMKTPGCQSPKPRSPDSGFAGKLHTSMGTIPLGHGKHAPKLGLKPDAANLYHHKHVYHHVVHHHGALKPKEQVEAESSQRAQGSFAFNFEAHSYAAKARAYGDSLAPGPLDSLGYR